MMSRRDNKEKTTERVLAAAEQLFTAQSFRSTTIRDIARTAGVSIGTVMGVGDKDTLLVTVLEQHIRIVHDTRSDSVANEIATNTDPTTAIVALIRPFIDMFRIDPGLSREYAAILVRGTHSSHIFTDLAAYLIEEIHAVLKQAGLDDKHARTAAHTIHLSYLGLLFIWASRDEDENPGFFDEFRAVIQSVLPSHLRKENEKWSA